MHTYIQAHNQQKKTKKSWYQLPFGNERSPLCSKYEAKMEGAFVKCALGSYVAS